MINCSGRQRHRETETREFNAKESAEEVRSFIYNVTKQVMKVPRDDGQLRSDVTLAGLHGDF